MPIEFIVVPAVFIIGIPSAVLLTFRWFRHREHMATVARGHEHSPALEERLGRLEQAVDAIAVEMERVGEGQRFVTKLLADRAPARPEVPAAQHGRVITPH